MAEALVALAIAALLAATLTRLVGDTRMNAGKVRELVEMMTLSDSLLEHVSQMPATSDGRTGEFTWHISVEPFATTAVARKVNLKGPAADQSAAKTTGLPPMAAATSNSDAASMEPEVPHHDAVSWVPSHVTILVKSPSGRTYVADTVRISLQPTIGLQPTKD